jgi:hypothetical protein
LLLEFLKKQKIIIKEKGILKVFPFPGVPFWGVAMGKRRLFFGEMR